MKKKFGTTDAPAGKTIPESVLKAEYAQQVISAFMTGGWAEPSVKDDAQRRLLSGWLEPLPSETLGVLAQEFKRANRRMENHPLTRQAVGAQMEWITEAAFAQPENLSELLGTLHKAAPVLERFDDSKRRMYVGKIFSKVLGPRAYSFQQIARAGEA